jgi:hypothetical protein
MSDIKEGLSPKEQALDLFKKHEDYSECAPSCNWKHNTVKAALITVDMLIVNRANAPLNYEDKKQYYWNVVEDELKKMIEVTPPPPIPNFDEFKYYYLKEKPLANSDDIKKIYNFYKERNWLKFYKSTLTLRNYE